PLYLVSLISFCTCHFSSSFFFLFLFNAPSPPLFYTLSLHDALPIFFKFIGPMLAFVNGLVVHFHIVKKFYNTNSYYDIKSYVKRSEEHTSELQSRFDLVCRLLLEKKKKIKICNIKIIKDRKSDRLIS